MVDVNTEAGAMLAAVRTYADRVQPGGMSQSRLAGLLGVSAGTVSNLEHGKTKITAAVIAAWQRACNAPFGIYGLMAPEPTNRDLDAKLDQLLAGQPGPFYYTLDVGTLLNPTLAEAGFRHHIGQWDKAGERVEADDATVMGWLATFRTDPAAARASIAAYVQTNPPK